MFETFNVTGLYIANPAVLSLYADGKFYGISIDSGESTSIVPIFDGYPISFFTKKLNIGGKDLTNYFAILLEKRGYRFSTTAEKEIIKAIKEKSCYMALDYQEELKSVEPYDYELPDGTHVIVKDERIRCTEALFRPDILGKDDNGLGQICYDVIQSCDIDIRRDMARQGRRIESLTNKTKKETKQRSKEEK
jgi:actin